MAVSQRGKNGFIDFTFKGQRIMGSIGPSAKGDFVLVNGNGKVACRASVFYYFDRS